MVFIDFVLRGEKFALSYFQSRRLSKFAVNLENDVELQKKPVTSKLFPRWLLFRTEFKWKFSAQTRSCTTTKMRQPAAWSEGAAPFYWLQISNFRQEMNLSLELFTRTLTSCVRAPTWWIALGRAAGGNLANWVSSTFSIILLNGSVARVAHKYSSIVGAIERRNQLSGLQNCVDMQID